ncbi:hypothetical protein Tsubulata_049206 [Turnera subulata]|uniref:Homeobox domain-containing protein n=1 Tax=Turnera subulata TaxID=218843 RepID=A0A9Q0GE20_9ROSI|nr:hypothetical protein Tsubulata_049206 [Turnera subulata]
MWMMGYNDGGDFNIPDSCNSRRLRPLFPRPVSSANITSTSTTPCLSRLHGTDLFALNQHLATMADQGKRDFNTQPVVVSSRWNPTPEQLRTLEELYRRGTRTPSAEQIQHITAQLRRYGKIEGKNVFYWFQNHKARERQKRRRQLESAPEHDQQQYRDMEIIERKESGVRTTGYEGEQTKNWVPSTNCSTLTEESISIPRATKAAMAECRTDGWIQFDEGELQLRKSLVERNATWQMMQLSCPSPTHLINTSPSSVAATATPPTTKAIASNATTPTTTTSATIRTMDPNKVIYKAHDHHHLNMFIAPYRGENGHGLINQYFSNSSINEENGCGESQTLQLFPLRSSGTDGEGSLSEKETHEISVAAAAAAMNASLAPCQFFEFLPLKN